MLVLSAQANGIDCNGSDVWPFYRYAGIYKAGVFPTVYPSRDNCGNASARGFFLKGIC